MAIVPRVTTGYIADNTVREILPYAKREVDLQQQNMENKTHDDDKVDKHDLLHC